MAIRIPNFTKSEVFKEEIKAKEFMKIHEGDCDVAHWKMETGSEFWVVYYESNGYYEYPDLQEI